MNVNLPKPARRWLPLALLVIVTGILAFVIRDFVRQVIVLPVVYVGWYTWIVLNNLPYWTFWTMLLAVVIAIAMSSLRRNETPRRLAPPPASLPQGPVVSWQRLLAQAQRSTTARRRLSRSLGLVLWHSRFPDLPYNEAIFAQHADDDALGLPPELRAYFAAGLQRDSGGSRRLFHRARGTSPLDLPPKHAVAFLEDALNPSRPE